MDTHETFYRLEALRHKGTVQLKRFDMIALVEAEMDKDFWEDVFKHYLPSKKILFLPTTKSPSGNYATGCARILKFAPYFDASFVGCIDSDFRYLHQQKDIDIEHFIFQTYTYAIENHYCYHAGLKQLCERHVQSAINFDFEMFLTRFSEVVYDFFVLCLYSTHYQLDWLYPNQVWVIISEAYYNTKLDFTDNGMLLLDEIAQQFDAKLAEVHAAHVVDHKDVERYKKQLTALGLHAKNTYLYIRGHNVHRFILRMMRHVSGISLKQRTALFTNEELGELYHNLPAINMNSPQDLQYGAYPEIRKIQQDALRFIGN